MSLSLDNKVEEELRGIAGNIVCCDCDSKSPQWASVSFGVFMCLECSGRHRSLGVHLSFVRSVSMDSWTEKQIQMMRTGGNQKCIAFLQQHGVTKDTPIPTKYNSPAAQLYRDRLLAEVEGRPLPTELPDVKSRATLEFEARERLRLKFGNALPPDGNAGGDAIWSSLAALLPLLWIVCLAVTVPFTKVEESFNMQAVHDFLVHGSDLSSFDHLEFPGVVPRTFWGAALLALICKPMTLIVSPNDWQLVVRVVMGSLLWATHFLFARGISAKFGSRVASLASLLLSLQFHLPFYMSRTLPNMFALAACNLGFAHWLNDRHLSALVIIAIAMVVFRCDLLVLLVPLSLQFLLTKKVQFWPALTVGVAACLAALGASVAFDSHMWQSWLWPEGVVLFFNTALNKSSEWGVNSWHWYASSALPRALHAILPLAASGLLGFCRPDLDAPAIPATDTRDGLTLVGEVGACLFSKGVDRRVAQFILPAFAFVALYSLLPHKELRFIFPVLPLLTLAAAVGLDRLLQRSNQIIPVSESSGSSASATAPPTMRIRAARWYVAAAINTALILLLFMALAANRLFWISAAHNYPGGYALQRLVDVHLPAASCRAEQISVHIGVDAAVSGVTRFGHRAGIPIAGCEHKVVYSKEEGLGASELAAFEWLLSSPDEMQKLKMHDQFDVVDTTYAFKKLAKKTKVPDSAPPSVVRLWGLPFQVELAPAIIIARRKSSASH